jgi:acyl-CoA synthetase (AMP-forming)/AMP-acid ligase II
MTASAPSCCGLLQGYSQTEGGPITALTPDDHRRAAAHRPELLGSAGRAVRDTEVIIHGLDGDGIGEVWARGGHLAAPASDGWLHTGDLGRLGADGYLYLSGRKGDMIIRGGENVYPEEVENRIASHPGIREAAVVGAPHEVLGEEVVAFIVPASPGESPDAGELRRYVRQELAGFKVPARWHVVEELPRGALGKVLRRALRAAAAGAGGGEQA